MSNYAISLKRTTLLLLALAFTAVLTIANLSIFSIGHAGAAQITARSLSLTSSLEGDVGASTAANSETNGADASHTITFDPATTGTIESLRFDYCTTAIGACTGPTGLVVNAGTAITTQTNEGVTFTNAYAIDGTSDANTLNVDNATGNTFTAGTGGTIVFTFDDITNPTDIGTFFVRITTYTNDDYTGAVDNGTVASSITNGIAITSRVVETLGFSTTTDDSGEVAEGASCAALGGSTSAITLGDVTEGTLSISQAYDEFSAFRLYTNSANGTVVQYEGSTLTKGADNINAIGGTATASAVGTEQFGLAVDADGASLFDGDNGGFGGAGQLALNTEYDGGDGTITNGGTATFAFVADTKTTLATSSQHVTCDTAAVRYIGNISPLTPAGTYTTTIVYFAVPTY